MAARKPVIMTAIKVMMKANKIYMVKSNDYACVIADEFEVLIDPNPANGASPAIGLLVKPIKGRNFIVPIEFEAAVKLSENVLDAVARVAPHLVLALLNR